MTMSGRSARKGEGERMTGNREEDREAWRCGPDDSATSIPGVLGRRIELDVIARSTVWSGVGLVVARR